MILPVITLRHQFDFLVSFLCRRCSDPFSAHSKRGKPKTNLTKLTADKIVSFGQISTLTRPIVPGLYACRTCMKRLNSFCEPSCHSSSLHREASRSPLRHSFSSPTRHSFSPFASPDKPSPEKPSPEKPSPEKSSPSSPQSCHR